MLNGKNFLIWLLVQKSQNMGHLTQEQRYTIEVLRKNNYTLKEIGAIIGKDKSVICRELKRNSDNRNGVYRSDLAERKCKKRHREKPKIQRFTMVIKEHIDTWLKEDYSPEQIVGLAKIERVSCVSIERIYQYVWKDKKDGGELYTHLRSNRKTYRKRGASKDKRGQIFGRIGIEKRPVEVDQKQRIGDTEVDLIIGKDHKGALVTINDSACGLLKMRKSNSKEASEIEKIVIKSLEPWKPFMHTMTSDNGKEFANHLNISKALEIKYYFARPYHSWERGANENLNGLLRQYFPKGTDFNLITDEQVKIVEEKLNNRPRKRFGYLTPNQVYLSAINNNGKVAFIT